MGTMEVHVHPSRDPSTDWTGTAGAGGISSSSKISARMKCVQGHGSAVNVATLRMQLQPGTCPFPELRLWGKMTMPNAGTMAYRRDLPSTTRI